MPFEHIFDCKIAKLILELQKLPLDKAIFKLQKHPNKQLIINQLDGSKRVKTKLPTWYSTQKIVYPPKINLEQCSSEIAAAYKSKIASGKHLIDLTGGFGVDSFYFTKTFESVDYVEKNDELYNITKWNFIILGTENITTHKQNCEEFIDQFQSKYSSSDTVFFIDPARRSETNQKLVQFSDCEPNIITILPKLFAFADTIFVKASPMQSINQAIDELKYVTKLHIVSIKNECKELLFELNNKYTSNPEIITINIDNIIQKYSFMYNNINCYISNNYSIKNIYMSQIVL